MLVAEMIKAIIFDWNRTLYDVENDVLFPGVLSLLKQLQEGGIKLAVVSANVGSEKNFLEDSRFSSLFYYVCLVAKKDPPLFRSIINELEYKPSEILVVGDRIQSEIQAANKVSIKTVWLKRGKYAVVEPRVQDEEPTWTISSLHELQRILDQQ
jgi:FMN phosphatase YigB (HAD superfamily)